MTNKNTIIIEGFGQLANRIIQYSHFIASGKEYGLNIYNPDFKKYACYFKGSHKQDIPCFLSNDKDSKFPAFLFFIFKIQSKFIKKNFKFNIGNLLFFTYTDENDFFISEFANLRKKYIFIKGWNFRDYENVKKHYTTIVSYFEPVDQYKREIENFINPLKEKYDILVGVHIRRGDYKEWQNGKYYFSDEVYFNYLSQLKNIFANKNTLFIIFSDEKINIDYYKDKGLNVILSEGDMILDIYRMASCDYIIGPVSTFNLWASYYGKKPHRYIKNSNEIIKLDDFKIIETL
ncbi:MAG TPA: alpha-1,2-fucosyltransferase [Spirochaetota bacterium]|nr:alpha-1,2-fucosyltransferase [Spirochaetota bacterium]HPP03254.1 alpha-1,2-fucosyltransferase [Spirochaetota bacterium]